MPLPASSALPLNVTPSATPARPTANQQRVNGTPSAASGSADVATDISSPHELTAFVETLLEQLDAKFDDMSSQILDRMNQMSARVDALEASIQDIINGDATNTVPSLPQSPSVTSQRRGAFPS
ncbi:heat shock factor binding protein 1-domain-containing protein [Cristinia sonorae]|uniref:Heat shock factor binding protein 1-domain-containing protein n=1 Tax=Cristinia sonorae TaxID=1940300 RepID=A0A8K0UPV1_9AGAR|nr:heat shock factor binding protein 1-domain-containing protein [Cristinia sonorae]